MMAPAHGDGTREPLRIGVVGGGFIAQTVHLPLLRELGGWFRLEAIAEPSRRVRDALAARYAIAGVHAGHRELLDAGGLDAVVVCAPNALHERIVLDALDAGLHVLVEKPLCLSAAGAERIAARAAASRRVVQVGYMKRFAPAYEALLDDLHSASTEIVHVASLTCDPRLAAQFAPRGLVRGDDVPRHAAAELAAMLTHQAAEAAGCDDPGLAAAYSEAFAGALVHDVNAVHGMLDALGVTRGEPVDAYGDPAAELASGSVALPGGARWTMAWALVEEAGAFSERIELLTRDGLRTMRFPAPYLRAAPVEYTHARAAGATGVRTSGTAAVADPYERQLRHFHACVTAGATCRTPPAQAARDLALLGELFALGLAREAIGAPA
jgi:predicted dehydrogenase